MITRLLLLLPLALSLHAQPFSPQDPVFSQNCSSLFQGLVGYWRLEEASGVRYDMSSKNNTLTSNNSVGQAVGKVGNCSQFTSASSQRLSIADNVTLSLSATSFTVAAWVKATTLVGDTAIIAKWNGTGADKEYALWFPASTSRFSFTCQKADNSGLVTRSFSSLGLPVTNTWYFLCAWTDGTNISAQANNGTIDTIAFATDVRDGTSPFWIGGFVDGSGYWNGLTDEVGVWKRTLTTSERTQLYNAGLGTHFPWAHP